GLASSPGFARRTRAATEATGISRRLPRLLALRLGRSYRSYCGRVRCLGYGGRLFNRFRRRLPCGARFRVVLLEAALFVLAARSASAPCYVVVPLTSTARGPFGLSVTSNSPPSPSRRSAMPSP